MKCKLFLWTSTNFCDEMRLLLPFDITHQFFSYQYQSVLFFWTSSLSSVLEVQWQAKIIKANKATLPTNQTFELSFEGCISTVALDVKLDPENNPFRNRGFLYLWQGASAPPSLSGWVWHQKKWKYTRASKVETQQKNECWDGCKRKWLGLCFVMYFSYFHFHQYGK